jgi:hypothetical protein
MVSVWNPADEAQDFAFTLYFTGGHYTLPLHLEPRATRNLNVSEIIQNQVPDADGNIIPAAVHEGTAKIAGSQAENEAILVAIQAGIYNVRKATCGQVCDGGCSGYVAVAVVISPFTITAGGTKQLNFVATYISGGTTNLAASWSSSDTNVATVGTGTGLVQGVGAGSVYITATSLPNQPIGIAPLCHSENWHCPTTTFAASGSGTVKPAISGPTSLWWFKGLSLGVSGYSNQITLTALPTSGTYSWAVASGSSKVSLSGGTTSSVTVTSIGQSTTANDVSITATVGGITSAPFQLTVRAPYALSSDPSHPTPVYITNPTYVWETDIYYQVVDNFLTPMPVPLPVNEYFTTGAINDYSGTNWRPGIPGCLPQTLGAAFFDQLGGETPSRVPTPVYNVNWTGVKVQHWGQDWHVGTCNLGFGPRVQSDTIQKWTDHALHTNIIDPNP